MCFQFLTILICISYPEISSLKCLAYPLAKNRYIQRRKKLNRFKMLSMLIFSVDMQVLILYMSKEDVLPVYIYFVHYKSIIIFFYAEIIKFSVNFLFIAGRQTTFFDFLNSSSSENMLHA